MSPSRFLPEIDLLGKKTVQWTLDARDCAILRDHRILSFGHSEAGPGYRVLRQNPAFSNINLTLFGYGEALIQGEWQKLTTGTVSLAPQGVRHGARTLPGKPWEFCWICFEELPGTLPRIAVPEPTLTHADPRPLSTAVINFYREWRDTGQKTVLDALLHLINLYVQRITAPWPVENHLWKLWEQVAQFPAHTWTDEEMARLVHVSSRHLLRLCKKESGRTLHEQLSHIRLTKAASLLQDRSLKLHAIAQAVGYQDAFAFSKAFKRWRGVSPKDYRAGF